jgi:TetR/AcrR family transcriptional repressor of nem operon
VGVSEICSAAGVKKGSFYHFFASKRDLVSAVIESYWDHMAEGLDATLGGEGSPIARLERFFAANANEACRGRDSAGHVCGCPLGNLALELSTQDEVLRDKLNEVFGRWTARLASVLEEATAAGELNIRDPEQAAADLVAFLEGRVLFSKLRNDPDSLADIGPRVLAFLRALPPQSAQQASA